MDNDPSDILRWLSIGEVVPTARYHLDSSEKDFERSRMMVTFQHTHHSIAVSKAMGSPGYRWIGELHILSHIRDDSCAGRCQGSRGATLNSTPEHVMHDVPKSDFVVGHYSCFEPRRGEEIHFCVLLMSSDCIPWLMPRRTYWVMNPEVSSSSGYFGMLREAPDLLYGAPQICWIVVNGQRPRIFLGCTRDYSAHRIPCPSVGNRHLRLELFFL